MSSSLREWREAPTSAGSGRGTMEAILEGIGDGFFAIDEDWRFTYFNSVSEQFFRCARSDVLGHVMWERFPVLLGTEFERRYRHAMVTRNKQDFEVPSAVMPGHILEVRSFPILKGLGISFRDVTERHRAALALRESEARFRHVADSVPALVWMTDTSGQVIFTNRHFFDVFNSDPENINGSGWKNLIFADDLPRFQAEFLLALNSCDIFQIEVRVANKDSELRWLRCKSVPRRNDASDFVGYIGCAIDITEVKLAQMRQHLLTMELNHRVKNTLATVQSIISQTLRNAKIDRSVHEQLERRLIALARTHDVLTRENWEGAELAEIISQAIAPYRQERENRFLTDGPSVRLPPRMALAIAMALQELVTNAVKYGSLSTASGEVDIRWTVLDDSGGAPCLRLRWQERGGPEVTAPARRGFGSRLIERGLAQDLGGTTSLEFAPHGLVCRITAPLPLPMERDIATA